MMSTVNDAQAPDVPPQIEGTARAIAEAHADHHRQAPPLQRAVSKITAALGRPGFVLVLTSMILVWVGANLTVIRMGWDPWDPPPFTKLTGAASLVALYTTVLILATQRHDDELARKRKMLTLEIAILTKQKSAKIIKMLDQIRQDSPHLADRSDVQTQIMSDSADPHLILDALKDAHQSGGHR